MIEEKQEQEPALEKETNRLEAFSDGVIAPANTFSSGSSGRSRIMQEGLEEFSGYAWCDTLSWKRFYNQAQYYNTNG